jgi:hypothetical protein
VDVPLLRRVLVVEYSSIGVAALLGPSSDLTQACLRSNALCEWPQGRKRKRTKREMEEERQRARIGASQNGDRDIHGQAQGQTQMLNRQQSSYPVSQGVVLLQTNLVLCPAGLSTRVQADRLSSNSTNRMTSVHTINHTRHHLIHCSTTSYKTHPILPHPTIHSQTP